MTTRRPSLIASDLDGTLVRTDGTVSARTVAAVRAVQDAGMRFVVATARPPRWMHDVRAVVGDHGLAICSNGAFSYDVLAETALRERTIARDVVLEVVDLLRKAIPQISFAVENRLGFGMEPSYVDGYRPPSGAPVGDIAELLDPLPGKLLASSPAMRSDEFLSSVAAAVGDRVVLAFSGTVGLAEMTAHGVTKAAVLAEWCAEWGVAADEVVAFGDMPNDLAMLRWAGTSYAVANAHPDVTKAATHSCGSNDEDGVAAVLEKLLVAHD